MHANQLGHSPGVQLAAELRLVAIDHCTYLSDADVDALRDAGTIATLLPGVALSTKQPYPHARRLFDAGVQGALAPDFNPGPSHTPPNPFSHPVPVRTHG